MRHEPEAQAPPVPTVEQPQSWAALWRTLTRFESEKLAPGLALRNSLGVVLPIAAGIAAGAIATGLILSTGALNVSFSDADDPYRQRARRMLAASVFVGVAVFFGSMTGRNGALAVLVAAAWAFASGMLVATGQTAADIGVVSLVTLVVFAARPLSPENAAWAGLLACAGGLLQTVLALALWPLRRYEPERRALGNLFLELARAAASPVKVTEAPPASQQSTQARKTLATLGRDRSVSGERYRALLNQAERIRLSLMTLARLRGRIERDGADPAKTAVLDGFFEISARLLDCIGNSLLAGAAGKNAPECLREISGLKDGFRDLDTERVSAFLNATLLDARFQMNALAGQLRSAVDLAAHATPEGIEAFEESEARKRWNLRLAGTVATLRANLSLKSAACRHAIRLAVCVAVGDAIGRGFEFQRSYWLPMTIAIVLKPDFTSTFSRGVLRVAGTLAGLALATGLFHIAPLSIAMQTGLIAVFMFLLRWLGPANYGVFAVAVSALVVLLVGLTGVAPKEVIAARALNTVVGGSVAMLAYWLWPTWERTRAQESMALMLDSYRDYFRIVAQGYLEPATSFEKELDRARQDGRLARSNLEASVERMIAEPGTPADLVGALASMLASSHRMVHAFMALEAGLSANEAVPAREAFRAFANDVDRTLYFLAAGLRGFRLMPKDLPDLREDHDALLASGDAAVGRYALTNVETDRVTNSLNTLREQIVHWIAANGGSV